MTTSHRMIPCSKRVPVLASVTEKVLFQCSRSQSYRSSVQRCPHHDQVNRDEGHMTSQFTGEVKSFKEMPGPGGIRKVPYIGTLTLFKPFSSHTIETFHELVSSNHNKYGPIFKMKLGREYSVFSENVEDVQNVMQNE